MNVWIYAEGGGEGRLYDTLFRQGWQAFFRASGLEGRMPRVIRGGSRARTFDLFVIAVDNPRPNVLPLLLVDSEGPVEEGHTAWQHLLVRDGWTRPAAASEAQAFLMVQVMETWFLADRDLLRRYFGQGLRESVLRAWPNLEAVSKDTVLSTLDQATANCRIPYRKGKVSFELLEQLNPAAVENACLHARLLLDHLRNR